MPDDAVFGPIDFVLLEFPADADTTRAADAIMDLVRRDVVHIYDLLVIRKAPDGSYRGVDLTDLTAAGVGGFTAFAGARSGLLGDEDLREAAEVLRPGTMAALIVFENTWAAPFVAAAMEAGGQVVASERIPAADVIAALDTLDTDR